MAIVQNLGKIEIILDKVETAGFALWVFPKHPLSLELTPPHGLVFELRPEPTNLVAPMPQIPQIESANSAPR